MLHDNATSSNARRGGDRRFEPIEPEVLETALSVPETDPERIAFNLWNEGRVDEAIQFLEREIATRRESGGPERHAGSRHAGSNVTALARIEPDTVEPVSDWRERHRTALSPADFNAFGAAVHTIDLVARPADSIVPHPPRRSHLRAWVMGLGLAVIGLSAAAVFWSGRGAAPGETVAAVQPTAEVEPVTILPPADAKREAGVASAEVEADATADSDPALAEANAEVADAPPPDDELSPEDVLPPEDIASDPTTTAPVTTASIDTAPASPAPAAIVEARLPRQRPEPPADALRAVATADPSPPVVYAPGPAPYDSIDPRPTLTPAEYQVLLERRAWAENYVSRRRAYAERRAMEESPRFLGDPRPVIRLRRN